MNMLKMITSKLFVRTALAITVLAGCKKNNDTDYNAPAYRINESEKLVIPPSVDIATQFPGNTSRVLTLFARGVQRYKAQAKAGGTPDTYEWVFVAPQAALYDASNKIVGTHSAGPNWELSPQDSLFAQHFAPAKTAAAADANSIDWLLLMPKAGKTPTGIFANVAYIQRIATSGGKAPSVPPVRADETVDVPYTAIYRFTQKK